MSQKEKKMRFLREMTSFPSPDQPKETIENLVDQLVKEMSLSRNPVLTSAVTIHKINF